MIVTLQTRRLRSIEQVWALVESMDYGHRDRENAYGFVGELLKQVADTVEPRAALGIRTTQTL